MFRLMLAAACVVSAGLLAQGAPHAQGPCNVEPDGGFFCGLNGGVSGFDISPGSKRVREQIMALVEERRAERAEGGTPPMIASAQMIRSQIRLASAPTTEGASGSPLSLYLGGFGVFEDQNTTERQIGLQSSRYGGFIGADWKFRAAVIGAVVDLSQDDIDFDEDAGDAEQPEIGLGVYGAVDFTDRLYAFIAGRVGLFDYDTNRKIQPTGATSKTSVKGDTNGYNLSIGGGVGYNARILEHMVLNLSGSLSYFHEKYDGYTEDEFVVSSIDQQFKYDSFADDNVESSLGVAAGFPFDLGYLHVVPTVFGDWIYSFLRDTKTRKVNATSSVEPTSFLQYPTNRPDRNQFEVGGGVNLAFGESGWSAIASYSSLLGNSDIDRHTVTAALRRSF